jgi:hypothetical protein
MFTVQVSSNSFCVVSRHLEVIREEKSRLGRDREKKE